ncbi:LysR family transcriptional regulator [Uliginosibacterium sp. H3]|uniref:LysR family transcriptional regulator n=1 Tax=Uliginosibacterium silvisoli TaxID=3114758 RepID=A0ABU6K1H1_9RHOO|nr:LysR family transcriptional regulator [Uliginosibacterium sp. H3]
MARAEVNRSGEMEVFVKVIEQGGFSAAARACRMTPSAVSKLISRLESRLKARLINRSTRGLQLTPEGHAFYERAIQVLADLEEAERGASLGEQPVGRIRINTSASFGFHILAPLLPEFLARYPGITLDITHTDTVVDLLEARVDVAVRAGPLKSSSLVARSLGATRKIIVGAPDYLARAGTPRSLAELEQHERLGFAYTRSQAAWQLVEGGRLTNLPVQGRVKLSDGESLRKLALCGVGLARLAEFTVCDDIRAGRLVALMEDHNPGDLEDFHAVFLGGKLLPARVRVLLDFLVERGRVDAA